MKCSKCNFDNDSDALFCEKCGVSLSSKKIRKKYYWRGLNNRKIKIFIISIILLCVLFLVRWGIVYFSWWNPIHYFRNHDGSWWYVARCCIVESNNKYGVTKGYFHKEIIPIQYDEIGVLWLGDEHPLYFRVRLNNKWGLVNENNHILLPIIYDKIGYYDGTDYLYLEQNGKNSIIYLSDLNYDLSKLRGNN